MKTTKLTKLGKLALAMGSLMLAGGAMAADSGSGSVAASAHIDPECAVGNTTALDFSAMTMLTAAGAQATGNNSSTGGTFDAICTNGTNAPKLRFTSANSTGTDFRLVGADTTSFIVYTLAESGGTAIAHGSDAGFTGLAADGTTKSLRVVGTVTAAARNAKAVQLYADTITITSSYTP